MDQIFNINRFGSLILRSLVQHKQIYLRLSIICVATLLVLGSLASYFNLNIMTPYIILINFIITIAPAAFFFNKRTHTSHFLEFTLPASVLEKFSVKLLNCIIIFPVYFILLSLLCIGIATIIPVEAINNVATQTFGLLKDETISRYWDLIAVQSIFLCGSYFFKDGAVLKTILAIIGTFIIAQIMIAIVAFCMLDFSIGHFEFGAENPFVSFETIKSNIRYILYIIQFLIPVGLWLASFYKLKETEI